MDNSATARLIDVAVSSLRKNILPVLATDEARIHADQITRVLWLASFHLSGRTVEMERLLHAQAHLLDEIESFNSSENSSVAQPVDPAHIEQRIKNAIPVLLEKAASSVEGWNLLNRLIGNERAYLAAQDPDITGGSVVVFRGGRIETERGLAKTAIDAAPSEAVLTRYFQKIRDDSNVSVRDVRIIPGGFSKSTIFFDLITSGVAEPLVMRKDMSLPFMNKTVLNEFPMLQHLYEAGFPVAEPLWLEKSREPCGSPFIISRRVAGTSDFQRWAGDPVLVKKFSQQLADIMARLHNLDLRQLGFATADAEKSAGEYMREELNRWIELYNQKKSRAHPLLDITFAWLSANIPAESFNRPARIVHGDIGFHNLMFADGEVTAVLDWEFSHFGDPLEDFIYTRMFIEQIMDWDEFTEFYISKGGLVCPPETDMFYGIWSRCRNTIGCIDAAYLFDTALPDEIKFAVSGHVFESYVELDSSEILLAGLKKILGH